MAYTAINSESIERFPASQTAVSHDLDSNTDFAVGVFKAMDTTAITRAVVYVTGTTGTRPTYRIGIESVDSAGDPTGTYLGATASAYADVSTLSNGQNIITLGESVTPSVGDAYAVTIRYQSGTINPSNFQAVQVGYVAYGESGHTYAITGDGVTTRFPCFPSLTGAYSTTSFVAPSCVLASITENNWGSSNSPLYRGASVQQTAAVELQGIDFLINAGSAPFDTHFLLNTDTSPTETMSWIPGENIEDTTRVQCVTWRFPSPVECPARAALRFLIEPTTTTAITSFPTIVTASSVARLAFVGRFAALGITATTLGSYSIQPFNCPPVRFNTSGVELPPFFFG